MVESIPSILCGFKPIKPSELSVKLQNCKNLKAAVIKLDLYFVLLDWWKESLQTALMIKNLAINILQFCIFKVNLDFTTRPSIRNHISVPFKDLIWFFEGQRRTNFERSWKIFNRIKKKERKGFFLWIPSLKSFWQRWEQKILGRS